MNVLITCEESQAVTLAFRAKGHKAFSNDIVFSSGGYPSWHILGDVFDILYSYRHVDWNFIGGHPPCTFMTNSGVRWLFNKDGSKNIQRWIELEDAVNFFNKLKRNIKVGYLENPIPHKYARDGFYSVKNGKWVEGIGKYDQIIHPWQFGHGEQKATCLWLNNLPKLKPTNIVEGREQRIWKLPPSEDRAKLRSKTFDGIAKAMAEQWSNQNGFEKPNAGRQINLWSNLQKAD